MKNTLYAFAFASMVPFGLTAVHAADDAGNYAVRGAGSFSCEQFRNSVEADDPAELNQFLSWVQGHITASNRATDDTFDLYPILSPTRIGAMLYNLCGNYPETRLEEAVVSLNDFMMPGRVTQQSDIAQLSSGEASVAIRSETLARIQQALVDANYYEEEPDALFDERMQNALRQYQQDNDLPVTGLPDADTIMALFY
ncbi:peptidoglycan-binding domain-containing protein [Halomonas alkaliantarctica]|uniref:peptidoglycan-binding domain-containing protein n=1 Tax=Halomonas alkaliantarctica TaxID=232346 RepID=UPI0004AA02EA|nr:peptidoglycan-binding domain-containing protein [Halomonas alkaliantarctica]